jgi:hypothetical protein
VEEGDTAGIDNLVEMFSDNAELTNPIIEREGSHRSGRDEIAEFWRDYRASLGDIHSEFFDVTASDHSAGLFWRTTGKNATGQPLEYEGVTLLMFDEAGKIAHFQGFFDSEKMTFKADKHA